MMMTYHFFFVKLKGTLKVFFFFKFKRFDILLLFATPCLHNINYHRLQMHNQAFLPARYIGTVGPNLSDGVGLKPKNWVSVFESLVFPFFLNDFKELRTVLKK